MKSATPNLTQISSTVPHGTRRCRAWLARALLFGSLIFALATTTGAQVPTVDPVIDSPMRSDPIIEPAEHKPVFVPGLKDLLLAALEDHEADTRRRAAWALSEAYGRGLNEAAEAAPILLALLTRPDPDRHVRLAAATTLIRMDHRPAAAAILSSCDADGLDMMLIADPALATWDYAPAREAWRRRISDPNAGRIAKRSAIESLGQVRDPAAFEALLHIAKAPPDFPGLALPAGRAAGIVRPIERSLVTEAMALAQGSVESRLITVALLETETSLEAAALLTTLANDTEPAVAAAALHRLDALKPDMARTPSLEAIKRDDTTLRRVALANLCRTADDETFDAIAPLLADPDVTIRRTARDTLAEMHGTGSLTSRVEYLSAAALSDQDWRVREQGAILSGLIRRSASWKGLLPLLNDPAPRVRLAAAYALRRVAVDESLPVIHAHVEMLFGSMKEQTRQQFEAEDRMQLEREEADQTGANERIPGVSLVEHTAKVRLIADTDRELVQLIQLLGLRNYKPADGLLRRFVPKNAAPWVNARAAAIWSLSKLNPESDKQLTTLWQARATDNNPLTAEAPAVRTAAIIALAATKQTQSIPVIAEQYGRRDVNEERVLGAARWALGALTGTMPPPVVIEHTEIGWFLDPLPHR